MVSTLADYFLIEKKFLWIQIWEIFTLVELSKLEKIDQFRQLWKVWSHCAAATCVNRPLTERVHSGMGLRRYPTPPLLPPPDAKRRQDVKSWPITFPAFRRYLRLSSPLLPTRGGIYILTGYLYQSQLSLFLKSPKQAFQIKSEEQMQNTTVTESPSCAKLRF